MPEGAGALGCAVDALSSPARPVRDRRRLDGGRRRSDAEPDTDSHTHRDSLDADAHRLIVVAGDFNPTRQKVATQGLTSNAVDNANIYNLHTAQVTVSTIWMILDFDHAAALHG